MDFNRKWLKRMNLLVQEILPFDVSGSYKGRCMCMYVHSELYSEDLCTMYLAEFALYFKNFKEKRSGSMER